jgi:hypothetical protein
MPTTGMAVSFNRKFKRGERWIQAMIAKYAENRAGKADVVVEISLIWLLSTRQTGCKEARRKMKKKKKKFKFEWRNVMEWSLM